jgi:hypothetical protein
MPETDPNARLYSAVYAVTYHAASAVLAFLQRDSYLYWPFIVATIVIALAAWRFGPAKCGLEGAACWREFRRRFLSRELWAHPSARLDYQFYLVNALLVPLVMAPVLFNEKTIVALLDSGLGAAQTGLALSAPGEARCVYPAVFHRLRFRAFRRPQPAARSSLALGIPQGAPLCRGPHADYELPPASRRSGRHGLDAGAGYRPAHLGVSPIRGSVDRRLYVSRPARRLLAVQ